MEFGSPVHQKRCGGGTGHLGTLHCDAQQRTTELGLLAKASLASPLKRPFSIVYQRQKFRLRLWTSFWRVYGSALCSKAGKRLALLR